MFLMTSDVVPFVNYLKVTKRIMKTTWAAAARAPDEPGGSARPRQAAATPPRPLPRPGVARADETGETGLSSSALTALLLPLPLPLPPSLAPPSSPWKAAARGGFASSS